ncbi:hypothetical protein DPMN_137035 [Dreissena polymorpha]|uniref:Uncharacterized protein n=1 Tax=Dreissena polymorpha TaxID=45954 RepID=A0A9D4G4R1_DREPO|nr:hypothetical protein DPMN_137035 [Dreissena polymorpha]
MPPKKRKNSGGPPTLSKKKAKTASHTATNIPLRVKEKSWANAFVDFYTAFSKSAFSITISNQGILFLTPVASRKIISVEQWTDAFALFLDLNMNCLKTSDTKPIPSAMIAAYQRRRQAKAKITTNTKNKNANSFMISRKLFSLIRKTAAFVDQCCGARLRHANVPHAHFHPLEPNCVLIENEYDCLPDAGL